MTAKPKKQAKKKVYPKIKLGSATAGEILAAYNITPAEFRRAQAEVRKIMDGQRRKAERPPARSAKARSAAR